MAFRTSAIRIAGNSYLADLVFYQIIFFSKMMLAYQRSKEVFPHLNEKEVTIDDFYRTANKLQVEVFELRLKKRGYCVFDLETRQDYIFLKRSQHHLKWLETAMHEIFHVIGLTEFEANAFRLVALIPLNSVYDFNFLDQNPTRYAFKLWQERQRVYFLYGV